MRPPLIRVGQVFPYSRVLRGVRSSIAAISLFEALSAVPTATPASRTQPDLTGQPQYGLHLLKPVRSRRMLIFLKHWHFQSNLPLSQVGVLKRRLIDGIADAVRSDTRRMRAFFLPVRRTKLLRPHLPAARTQISARIFSSSHITHSPKRRRPLPRFRQSIVSAASPLRISESPAGAPFQSDFPGSLTISFDIYIYIYLHISSDYVMIFLVKTSTYERLFLFSASLFLCPHFRLQCP